MDFEEKRDILCLQETKLQEQHVSDVESILRSELRPRSMHWSCSRARKGYSGTAILLLSSKGPSSDMLEKVSFGIGDYEGDLEGRSITLSTPSFNLVNVYSPNSGDLARLTYRTQEWDQKLGLHLQALTATTSSLFPNQSNNSIAVVPTILVGDLNVAHTHLDYYNHLDPATRSQPGTTLLEQESFEKNLLTICPFPTCETINVCKECDPTTSSHSLPSPPTTHLTLRDTYRSVFPHQRVYSFFNARQGEAGRAAKKGYRLDYILTNAHLCSDEPPFVDDQVSVKTTLQLLQRKHNLDRVDVFDQNMLLLLLLLLLCPNSCLIPIRTIVQLDAPLFCSREYDSIISFT